MDLAIEANRNSALFNTMQDVLDVYNPLLHKARPTVVNQTKQRIRTPAAQWGNTLDRWNGSRTARFNLPRIGSLVDASVKVAFRIPGRGEPSNLDRQLQGDRGYAKPSLTTGGLNNSGLLASDTARGRLDRVYADRLLGLNMIKTYIVSSKSREIFRATGDYLLVRFSQMDETMKEAVLKSTTPVDLLASTCNDMFFAPSTTYEMAIPLFMFFNEHISNAIDINFAEEVHIDIEFRAPSELFYYGNIGDLHKARPLAASSEVGEYQLLGEDELPGNLCWDQSTTTGASLTLLDGTNQVVFIQQVHNGPQGDSEATGATQFGTANVGVSIPTFDDFTSELDYSTYSAMTHAQMRHIQGIHAPFDGFVKKAPDASNFGWVGDGAFYKTAAYVHSSTTFAYPDVDNNGDSIEIQLELNTDFIIQDTDAYRALRAQTFPQGSGFTSIVFNTSQERFSNLMAFQMDSLNLLDARSGGSFTDPSRSPSGITVGDSTRYVELQLRDNHLTFATHFMVRKHSDMGGDGTVAASTAAPTYGSTVPSSPIGSHHIYTRALPVHYFQVLAAGRVIYESDGKTQIGLTQSAMYNGTGKDFAIESTNTPSRTDRHERINGRPFNIYSINWGLSASRLENTGCLSLQNLNNPVLRIYFKPDTWSEHVTHKTAGAAFVYTAAEIAASRGVQVDIIHEHFNVVTVNSGNGEITSGMNQ